MNNVTLYVPKLEDYWYEQKLLNDPDTMGYNAGYEVSYDGYHYDTGCIDFPESKWEDTYNQRKLQNKYFAYIKDNDDFVGYVNYHYNSSDNRYDCGIVIESSKRGRGYSKIGLQLLCDKAKKDGVKELFDNFEKSRESAIKVFKSVGFEIVEEVKWKKFGKEVEGVLIKMEL